MEPSRHLLAVLTLFFIVTSYDLTVVVVVVVVVDSDVADVSTIKTGSVKY